MASVSEANKSETCRVVYATICERCESTIAENVGAMTYAEISDKHKSEGNKDFFVYHDRNHNALFRTLIYDTCRSC